MANITGVKSREDVLAVELVEAPWNEVPEEEQYGRFQMGRHPVFHPGQVRVFDGNQRSVVISLPALKARLIPIFTGKVPHLQTYLDAQVGRLLNFRRIVVVKPTGEVLTPG